VFLVDKTSVSKIRIVDYQEYDVCGQLLYRNNEDNYGTTRHETGKNVIYIQNLMNNCCKQNSSEGTAVAQWLRYCATNWKIAASIPGGVIGIFH
jgi:hypothetical protein